MPTTPLAAASVSLVLPAFNEAANLKVGLGDAVRVMEALGRTFEIIVVDDGSADGTAELVGEHGRLDPRVRLIRHSKNCGYGAALRSGFQAAAHELVFFTDADLQFDLEELGPLLDLARHHDVVIGYRAPRRDPWNRRLNAWAWGKLVNRAFSLQVRDVNCAFKVFHRALLQSIELRAEGAFVNTELLAVLRARGCSIREVPVTHRPRVHGVQTGANAGVVLRAFVELIHLRGALVDTVPARVASAGLRAALSR